MKFNLSMNGLRGLLAMMVVLFHSYHGMASEGYINKVSKDSLFYGLEGLGKIAVYLFFVISGYLIIQSLMKSKTLKDFYYNRMLRIFPVFLVIHLIIFVSGPLIGYKFLSDVSLLEYTTHFFANMLLLPGVFDLPLAQIVAWSLSFEFAFYIVAGLFFVTNNKWFYIIPICVSSLLVYFHPTMLYFLLGVVLFYLDDKNTFDYKTHPIMHLNGIVFFTLILGLYGRVNISLLLLLNGFFFITILKEHGVLSNLMKTKLFQYLGNISYSLYLWHTLVMFPLKKMMNVVDNFISNNFLLLGIFTILSITISIIVSHYSFKFIEKGLVKAIKYKVKRNKVELAS